MELKAIRSVADDRNIVIKKADKCSCVVMRITAIARPVRHSNLSQEEWKAIRSLANDRNIVIKKTDKGACVVIWDVNYYIAEAEKQLSDKDVYKQVSFKEKT